MLNNIKLIGILFLSVLLLTNCKKENKQDNQKFGEIVFAPIDGNTEKSDVFDVLCDENLTVTHARVILNGVTYYPATFILGDKLLTQSIKLTVGQYSIDEFSLMDDMGTPGDYGDDMVVKSTPMIGSEYAQYVLDPIDGEFDFTIVEYEKFEFDVEVLCYLPHLYDLFGFVWFDVTEITIREQCFFGDFCIKDVNQYFGSLYGPDVMIDEVAIFKIVAYHNEQLLGEFYNTYYDDNDVLQYNSPLCVEYPDYDMAMDLFEFELWIYVTSGDGWDYVQFHTWTFWDAELIPAGDDAVVDFVLGNCVMDEPDLLLPPWMNLPMGITYDLSYPGASSYWDVTVSDLPPGNYWDIWEGDFEGWCADQGTTIPQGPQCMDAKSSLYPDLLPSYWLDYLPGGYDALTRKEAICAANWLWNHQADYAPFTTGEMQNAIWNLFNNLAVTGKALEMATDARGHCDYKVLPGGWAAIFFIPCYELDELQMTFFIVDP